MKTNLKSKKSLGSLIILVGLAFVPLSFVGADPGVSLYLTPSSGSYNVGNLINVSVKVNTGDETINAIKATLSFNEKLEVQGISKSGSIFGLWIEEPSYDNSLRTISFGGAGIGTSYKGSGGTIISITFKVEKAGKGIISFSSSLVKYGATTIDVDSATGGSYTINIPCICTSWQDKDCGGDDCSSDQRFQTRNCTPSGCALESRCIDDSSCVSQPPIEGEEEEEEEEIKKEEPETPVKKGEPMSVRELPRVSLLAGLGEALKEISQSTSLTIIMILCLIGLIFIGVKEWRLFQKKKKK